MNLWTKIEIRERTDAFGNAHRIVPQDSGFLLTVTSPVGRETHRYDADVLVRALNASDDWEAHLQREADAEAAEAAKWPKVSVKTIKEPYSKESIKVNLEELRPSFRQRTLQVSVGDDFVGTVHGHESPEYDRRGQKVARTYWNPQEPGQREQYWRKAPSMAEAIRVLINSHERRQRELARAAEIARNAMGGVG